MLEALGTKVMAGLVSLSMFLFSSFTGNDPELSSLRATAGNSYLQISTHLEHAFDNDFPELFRSGTAIPIHFKLEIKSGAVVMFTRQYTNSSTYNSATGAWTVSLGSSSRSVKHSAYQQMLADLGSLECSIPYDSSWGVVNVRAEAWMPTVKFDRMDRDLNLMVLWNYKRPVVKARFNLRKPL